MPRPTTQQKGGPRLAGLQVLDFSPDQEPPEDFECLLVEHSSRKRGNVRVAESDWITWIIRDSRPIGTTSTSFLSFDDWSAQPPKPLLKVGGSGEHGQLSQEVEWAASAAEPQVAVERLEAILERLEDSSAHAEARVRRLARKLPALPLANEPAWLPTAVLALKTQEGLSLLHEPALATAATLIRHLLSKPDLAELDAPTLSISASHAIEVDWGSRLTWLVYPAQLAWPAVHVRVYGSHNGEAGAARSFWYARSVAEHSARLLNC